MRRGKRSLALMLVLAMVLSSVPVSAAPMRANSYTNSWFGNFWNNLFNWNWNNNWNDSSDDEVVEEPETEVPEEQEVEKELVVVEDATTVENGELLRASTYSLRTVDASAADETAATYGVATAAEEESTDATADSTIIKYFPVTMYDYPTNDSLDNDEEEPINKATDALDDDLTVREGLYFSGGSPDYTKSGAYETIEYEVQDGNVVIEDGDYLLYNVDTSYYVNGTIRTGSAWGTTVLTGTNDLSLATVWTIKGQEDGTYTIQNADGEYMAITGRNAANMSTDANTVSLLALNSDEYTVQIYDVDGNEDYDYMNALGGSDYAGNFGGWSQGSTFVIRKLLGEEKIVAGYEAWNCWAKASGDNANGDLMYTGLVQNTLVDDQIKFNVNEGGIFSYTADEVVDTDGNYQTLENRVKYVYEHVGLPFVYDETREVYSFDSDVNGIYFADTDGDGNANPKSGSSDTEMYNLQFDKGVTQPLNRSVGDGSTNAWFPYNIYTTNEDGTKTYNQAINDHFGMRADLPFSMTANGRVKSTDNESTPITFTFSGDDDVWVFIDGVLVIDLGGIHNRLDATIDFAANTVTYSEENSADNNYTTGSYNDSDFATTQKLFTDETGTGLINITREIFAADEDHEMSVFYLERGKGTSNCRIEFNLPMMDSVIVTKQATESWSQAAEDADLALDPNDSDAGVDQLSSTEQAAVDNINFGFTLYKKDSEGTLSKVTNTNYYLLDATGDVINISSTDAQGHFYLKNGQSAKFITEIPAEGITYYVIEDIMPEGFITPDYQFKGEAAGGFSYINEEGTTVTVASGTDIPEQIIPVDADTYKSYEVTVKGSVEANDSVEFKCRNYLDAELPNPTALAYEDIIVIDYGLPVQIDPLANDVFRGENIEIVYVGGADVTLTETTDAEGLRSATWTEDNTLDSGTVVKNDVTFAVDGDKITRDTLTYTLNKQLTEVEEITYIVRATGKENHPSTGVERTQNDYSIGKVYIVPATIMYYEEDFSDLVTFTGSNWKGKVVAEDENGENPYWSDYQEPGVVGTTTDSTYGSDVAYLNDSEDSNGTSYYGDTTSGAIRFSYTFTGTGTSIFARTSAKTGYMQVKLYEGTGTSGKQLNITYRDTYYKDENASSEDASGTLYNIPVYTESDLDYGTYTVVATVAKAGTRTAGNDNGSGNEFYLDGIRIMQPLNENITYTESGDAIIPALTQKALGAYATDGESNIEVVTLRQKLITDAELGETPWNFAVLTDINGAVVTAEDYTSIGPKEEVYLEKGQSVSFAIKYWHQDGYKMYLGMKAPFGTGIAQVGQITYNLNNATDCYYDITGNHSSVAVKYEQAMDEYGNLLYTDASGNLVYEDEYGNLTYADDSEVAEDAVLTPVDDTSLPYYVATYTITATNKIVSLTNIKVTGNYEFVVVEDLDIDVNGNTNGGEQ